jgi:hypothetical protein
MLVLLVAVLPMPAFAQAPSGTHSPHGNLNIACQNCHTYTGWKPIRVNPEFNHNDTSYPLRGMHISVGCTECHTKPVFSNTPTRCAACHADLHKGQFGSSCEQCHSVKGWNVALGQVKQHQNRFPLIGAHAALDCESCHKGAATGQYQGLATQCYSCHAKDYQQTTGPSHVAAAFPTACEQCHHMDDWFGVSFDHLKYTGFALTGIHATLTCTQCHIGGKFKGTPATCLGCHLPDFQKTTNPNHVALNFPQTCQSCHTTSAWIPATFVHNLVGFPLTGAHTALQCTQCHVNNNYQLTSGACINCHQKDYNGTTNPNHVQAAFPTDCSICHSTTSWGNATFNHSTTGFSLTGAHATLQCTQCHVNGNYKLTSAACVTCHQTDYNKTTTPNHAQVGFPTTCDVCHNTTAWNPASFNHNNTAFPLTGAHTSLSCTTCHVNNNYTTLPTTCYGCHQTDYNNTTNPNHAAAQFPTTCTTCHSTTTWTGATFNHTWFPIYSGAHSPGVWTTCGTCHTNSSNYAVFSCTNCHTHNQGSTDSEHQGVGGYVYNSVNCYQCHPTGQGGG